MTVTVRLRALVAPSSVVLALTLACMSTEAEHPSKGRALVASPASPLPKGLVCGLSYTQSTDELSVQFTGGTFVKINYNNDFLGSGFSFSPPDPYLPVSVGNTTVHNAWRGSCNNVPTLVYCFGGGPLLGGYGPAVWHCHANANPQEGFEFHVAVDAGDAFRAWDNGAPGGQTSPGPWGFSYQAYVGTPSLPAVTGLAGSDRFVLPKGTACGLAHTNNGAVQNQGYANTDPTCMGYNPLALDASLRCPAGWASRYMFDMSSGNGSRCDLGLFSQPGCGFWAWCEYQDPHNLCDGKCLEDAVASGVALNLQSDTDTTSGAAWCSRRDSPGSPGCTCYGGSQSPFFDQGRGSGDGLSWCGNFSLTRESGSSPVDDYPSYCGGLATACNAWNLVPLTGPLFTSQGVYCEQPCTGYVGCFADNPSRVLPYFAGSGFTVDSCQQAAYNLGFRYAGVEYGGQCFLGNNLDGVPQIGQTPSCGMPCSANTSEICGGSWALSVYYSSNAPPQVANLSAAGSAAIDVPSAVQLQWAAPSGTSTGYTPASYNVYRGQFAGFGTLSWSRIASTTATSFLVSNLADGTQYFNVSAVDAAGEGRMSRNGVSAAAEHCDQATCPTGCCSGNSCLAGNVVSTGCATNGNVCAAPCQAGYTCSVGVCTAPCPPRTCPRGYIWDPDLCRCENPRL